MRRIPRRSTACALAVVLAAAGALTVAAPQDASACGGFFSRRATTTVTVPSLEVEQVLILHDPATEQEHFIRELVFRDAKEPFGFVVPTPAQPTVAKVDKSPFTALAARFPPEPPPPPGRGLGLRGLGGGGKGGGGIGAAPVTVLSEERIGNFTVFVLAATDASALKKWLDDNQLASTPSSDAWLAHYVKLGFYYAAFRYEMPSAKDATAAAKSETVRISFATPLPFYPYKEPDHPTTAARRDRVLAVWLASPARVVPVAAVTTGAATSWRRPWAEPVKHTAPTTADLAGIVGPQLGALLKSPVAGKEDAGGARTWEVQTFEDQKTNRRGWGDVVLVPASPGPVPEARRERMQKLMASLEPAGGGR
jgi:hypothetical protein